MKHVTDFLWVILLFVYSGIMAQNTSEKLLSEQTRLENKIATTKTLLYKKKSITEASLNELRLIDNQVKLRQELVSNFDNQVRTAEIKVVKKANAITALKRKLIRLKTQYRKLVIYAYKHRNRFGRLLFVFSAETYNEAIKRGYYLGRIADIQKKQFLIIKQHRQLIEEEIKSIKKERLKKLEVLVEKKKEKEAIEKDKRKQEVVYSKFKQEEMALRKELKRDEQRKEVLKRKINSAIQKEIAAAEAKRKKKEANAIKKAKENMAKKPVEMTESKAFVEPKKKEMVFAETSESQALNKSFEGNKGKLPWPVDKGSITEKFGKNAHPTLNNVYTNNNGIDITSPKNSQVKSVFEGEVTSVLNIPGAGKVVIIKHGNYRTVYSNLQDTYVKSGDKVSTKQLIGALLANEDGSFSIAHFEIHQVVGSNVQCLNPSLWVKH
jgi:septal ring factor EnvC (AmiA/AmiB activator)